MSDREKPGNYCYPFPRPSVTVDMILFSRDEAGLRVLLICRKGEPFADKWALPGGFLDMEESLMAAARRELKEETGIDAPDEVSFLGVYDAPGRDPRGRTISAAYVSIRKGERPEPRGGDDAKQASWRDPYSTHDLAFDHDRILRDALDWLERREEA